MCFTQVKVSELNVTWITKSYSPKGSDSNYPPPCTITQENLCRLVCILTDAKEVLYLINGSDLNLLLCPALCG